jgi:hypothetical protein
MNFNLNALLPNLKISYFHYLKSSTNADYLQKLDLPIITVVRNPKDSIASMIAMVGLDKLRHYINEYEFTLNFLNERADLIFKYEDINDKIKEIATEISKKYDSDLYLHVSIGLEQYVKWYYEHIDVDRYITSYKSPLFDEATDIVSKTDLTKLWDLYNNILKNKNVVNF